MTPERTDKFRKVVACRQPNLTVVLENVHDPHNIGAVLRSCDAVGIQQIFVLYTEPHLAKEEFIIGKRTSSGARHWVDVHYYTRPDACFSHVREICDQVFATQLGVESKPLHTLDFTRSTALIFGNERDGVSEEVLKFTDGNFLIPQVGMVESLNISVACAVSLYEAFRQRFDAGFYTYRQPLNAEQQQQLFEDYLQRHESKSKGKNVVVRKKG